MKGYAVGEVAEYLHPYEEVVRLTEAQAEIDSYKRTVKEEYAKREALEAEIMDEQELIQAIHDTIKAKDAEIDEYRTFIKLHADMHPIDRIKFMDFLNKHKGE